MKSVRHCRFQGRRKLLDAPELIFGKGLTALHGQEGTSLLNLILLKGLITVCILMHCHIKSAATESK